MALLQLWALGSARLRRKRPSKRAIRAVLRDYFSAAELLRVAIDLGIESTDPLMSEEQRAGIMKRVHAAATAQALPRADLARLARKCGQESPEAIAARLPGVQLTDLELLRLGELLRIPLFDAAAHLSDPQRSALVLRVAAQASPADLLARIRETHPDVL